MKFRETTYPDSLVAALIAPCGMNCGLCSGLLRHKDPCGGCRGGEGALPTYCDTCIIRNCDTIAANESGFCFECSKYPCARLRRLDKRYRTKYGMSMLENLERIRDEGIEAFVAFERERWACPECGAVICVHRDACVWCGAARG
ncbi:MAG: DUF3795 domain-containing protein [Actinomycetota bacterium]|nr:DUF3795 domain-containing protein [Actinomycetota bacterium]